MKALLLICLLALAAPAGLPANLALGRPYTLSPAPNYPLCTDAGDLAQLTDGKLAAPDTFWAQPAAVGWATSNPVHIVVDLGAVQPISAIAFSTASRLNAGVHWPALVVAVSDDGAAYHRVGQAISTAAGPADPAREYRQRLQLTGLRTRGRYVLFLVLPGGPYLFCDEVEVLSGDHDPAQVAFTSRAVSADSFTQYLGLQRQQAWLAGRAAALAAEVGEEASRARLAARLRPVQAALARYARELPTRPLEPEAVRAAWRELARLCAQASSLLHPARPCLVWERDPWLPLSPFQVPGRPLRRLYLEAASNEYLSAALTITNCTPRLLAVAASISGLQGAQAAVPAADIQVRRVQFVETVGGQQVADALPLLEQGRLYLPAGETSQLWLTFPKRRLPPGRYRGCVRLQVPGQAAHQVEVLLRVWPVELPDRMSLQTYNWAYLTTFPLVRGREREAVADLFAHYTDTFVFTGSDIPWPQFGPDGKGTIDFSAHDRNLELHRGAREISWFWGFSDVEPPDGSRFGAPYLGPQWRERFSWWLRSWVAHLQELGYGYADFFMYPFDETLCPRFRELARYMKEVDPRLRIFADPVSGDDRESIEAISPCIDIWCPNLPSYQQRPADLDFMRAQGDKFWTYVCSGPAKTLSPHGYYRLLMWQAWQQGFTGCGFWAYADAGWQGEDAWDDFDGTHHDYAAIYTAHHAPPGVSRREAIIPSKRWEAWREGIEDYELLLLADQAARRLELAGQAGEADALRRVAEQAVEAVLRRPDHPAALAEARHRLLAAASRTPTGGLDWLASVP